MWLRLLRQGNLFSSYTSADGIAWTLVGSATIAMPTATYVGLAVTSHVPSLAATATFTGLAFGSSTALPAPWSTADLGSPALAGSAALSGGTFTLKGGGVDIWGASDQFRFVSQPMTGDAQVVAYVASLTAADPWSKAGVMIRGALTASAPHASMFASGSNGWAFQRRLTTSGTSYHTAGPSGAAPGWVRIVREGNLFSAYSSANGTDWTLAGTDTISMPSTVYVGLAVTSHTAAALATATFTSVAVTAPAAGNTPPTVSLTAPAAGTAYTAPASISLAASAGDTDGTVASVKFYAGSTLIATDTSSPYSASWTNVAAGTYVLTAVATDNDGDSTTSSGVTVTVNPGANVPPSVALTGPAGGATYTAPASVTLSATASDTDGTVSSVQFYAGATLIGTDTTSPYTATWTSVPAGTYVLKAVATDNAGATTTSGTVSIAVTAANTPPTVALTAPAAGTTYTAPATITMSATASDANGTVSQVQFYAGTTLVGTDTSSPYSATWTNVPAGTYVLKAVATDNSGATAASSTVTITVNPVIPIPSTLIFVAPTDYATNVTAFTVELRRAADPTTATPVASKSLGKPAVVSGEISVDISAIVDPLAAGSYYAVVVTTGPGGSTPSSPSAAFVK